VLYCPRERVKEETCPCVSVRARPSVSFASEGRHMADSVCFISLTVYGVCVFLSGQDRWACGQGEHSVLPWPLSIKDWELKGEEDATGQETKSLWEECGIAGQKAGSKHHCLRNFE